MEQQLITDRVKTLNDVCQVLGKDYDVEFSAERMQYLTPDERAYKEWALIAQALNEDWVVNVNDTDQRHYWPVFERSAVGLSYDVFDLSYANAYVGARLVFRSWQLVEYAVNQFPDTFKAFFNNPTNELCSAK